MTTMILTKPVTDNDGVVWPKPLWVLKNPDGPGINGKPIMANKYEARNFKSASAAIRFVDNQIRISNRLTLDNFHYWF